MAPTAANDFYSTAPSTTLTVSGLGNGVLANDTDTNGPMNAVLDLGTWSPAGTAQESATATLLGNGKTLVTGGLNGTVPLASAELYDPAANTWSSVAPMATARFGQTATLVGTQVLIVGGARG